MKIRMSALAIALAFACSAAAADDAKRANATTDQSGVTVNDARREAQIWTSYAFNPHLRASDISVEVRGNRAVLTGTVAEGTAKELAADIANNVDGIETVDNRLTVDRNYTGKTTAKNGERDFATAVEDATITATVKSKLLWNDTTDGLEIDVDTNRGRVVLKGTADTEAAKALAGRLARSADGVIGVDNQLTLDTDGTGRVAANDPDGDDDDRSDVRDADDGVNARGAIADADDTISDGWITTKVKSTLLLSRGVEGTDIEVDTKNGVVHLKGGVDSNAERELAVELSKDVKGVKQVDGSGLKVDADERVATVESND